VPLTVPWAIDGEPVETKTGSKSIPSSANSPLAWPTKMCQNSELMTG